MSLKDLLFKKKKVLIVEDDVGLRTALKEKFEEKDFSVIEVGDAKDVLTIIKDNEPSALVLDLILPLKDGISLLEEVREEGHTLAVVILSNLLGSDSLRADAERLDATFYNKSATTLEEIVTAVSGKI